MGFRLRHGLTYCLVHDRPVFLDIVADRYFTLPAEGTAEFLALLREPDRLAFDLHPQILAMFEQNDGASNLNPAAATLPQDYVPSRQSGVGMGMLPILSAHAAAWLMLRRLPLEQVLQRVSPGNDAVYSNEKLSERASAFRASDAIVARADRCLLKAVAMILYLHRFGLRPTMIFGISLDPFRAHCWVQSGALLLNETPDVVRNFTPILVVR